MDTSGLKDYVISRNKFTNDKSCWLLTERYNSNYRSIYHNSKSINIHILSAVAFLGHVRSYGVICHKCDIKGCFNPEHLFIGTTQSNHKDAVIKGRKGNTSDYFKGVPLHYDFIETFKTRLNQHLDLIFAYSDLCH